MTTPILDWAPRHDPRSRQYPVRATVGQVARRDRLWDHGPILDQGREGACVGFAWAAEAFATPVPVDLTRLKDHVPQDGNLFARYLYGMAQQIDEWEGEGYSGTSVLAGAKATANTNLLREYRWAFNVDELADAVISVGPAVIGIPWFEGMYSAPGGILTRSGALVGGHALLVLGYHPESKRIPGRATFTLVNSWGADWGDQGLAEITVEDLAALLADRGEACVPVSRSYGRS